MTSDEGGHPVVLRHLGKTPAEVVSNVAGDIIRMVPALLGTRPCNVRSIQVRPIDYLGVPIAGMYDGNLVLHPLEVGPLAVYLDAKAGGTAHTLTEDARSEAKEAVLTILHETLHSAGPSGGVPTEAVTELLTERFADEVLDRLGIGELASAKPVLRGGYPGESAFLLELATYAARVQRVPVNNIVLSLHHCTTSHDVMRHLNVLTQNRSLSSQAFLALELERVNKAGWALIAERNKKPRSEWNGMLATQPALGLEAGKGVVRELASE